MSEINPGTLYLVPTPIGNLEDITERAVEILKQADIIAAEDTRHTRILLDHLGIAGHVVSYHEHNKKEAGPKLIEKLLDGQSVAQVSDAGMPVISDPGADLVRLALAEDLPIVPLECRTDGTCGIGPRRQAVCFHWISAEDHREAEEASDGYEPCACDAHFLRSAASPEGNAGYAHQVSRRQTGRDGKRAHEEIRDLPSGDAEGAPRRAG